MKARVQRWGNSLALRIPKTFAQEVGLESDSLVELSVVEGQLVVAPVEEPLYTLSDLLDSITEDNLHGEIDTGDATGNEIW